ncbi:MAG: hypothetical protein QOE65_2514 [Solirubrobacteraceae bacterium]|jgi:hypothetical protein|nr:hypothetical protein [Solirubrobacteraceae bacterium]
MAAILAAAFVAVPAAAHAQAPSVCLGDTTASGVAQRPGPKLRFGINPAGEAGALGPRVEPVPDDPARTLAALARLKPPQAPLSLRLNRFFWSDGEAGIQRFLALTSRYTAAGYRVELQLRYHPRPEQEGKVGEFVTWVRDVVRRFGANPGVTAVQVTNEVNFTASPDSSDGAYAGARDALVQGVIAAKDEARRRGYSQLSVGFNWFYRMDPQTEDSFWSHLRDHGGAPFVAALDWVGLDAYPGTVFPPSEPPGGERDGMVAAMSQLRRCFLPKAGIPDRVPIRVEENGWPTGPGRAEDYQAQALRTMVGAVNDFRGTYNVSDYRWFDLRDHATSSSNFQHHYGLLRDDYSEKPAFAVYRDLIRSLARDEPVSAGAPPRGPRVRLVVRGRRGRGCWRTPVRARIIGLDSKLVARVDFRLGARRAGTDTHWPFARALHPARGRLARTSRVRATLRLRDGRRLTLAVALRACPR